MSKVNSTKVKLATNLIFNHLTFTGTSASRRVDFNGFEMANKVASRKIDRIAAVEYVKEQLRGTPMTYQFWVVVFYEGCDELDIAAVVKEGLTVATLDLWLTDYITSIIDESDYECLGYGWVASPELSYDLTANEEDHIQYFIDQGVLDKNKRAALVQQYRDEQAKLIN